MNNKDIDAALAKLRSGAVIHESLPVIEKSLTELQHSVSMRVFQLLSSGKPIPSDVAVQAWIEAWSYHRLLSRLTQATRVGETAGETLKTHMKGENDG